MKKQGISLIGIIVFIGLIALIVWGLNYIITQDYVVVRAPQTPITNDIATSPAPTATQPTASSTPVTPVATVASSTPKQTTTAAPAVATIAASTPSTSDTSSGLTVTFTDSGFSPAKLTITKGQTVTFVNNSSSKMWVSANPFPSASDYPAFNEKDGTVVGDSWSFTFTKTGTWFYHNHYTPAVGAKIVVNAS